MCYNFTMENFLTSPISKTELYLYLFLSFVISMIIVGILRIRSNKSISFKTLAIIFVIIFGLFLYRETL